VPCTTPPAPHTLALAALPGLSALLCSISMLQFGAGNIPGIFTPADSQAVCCVAVAVLNSEQATKPATGLCG